MVKGGKLECFAGVVLSIPTSTKSAMMPEEVWSGNFEVGFGIISSSSAGTNPLTATAKSCILVWLDGGPSHLETFDPKPDAPQEVRGPLKTIPTNLTGVRISAVRTLQEIC